MSVGLTASVTVSISAIATVGAIAAAASTTSIAAMVALGFVATIFFAVSTATVTAYFDPESNDSSSYFKNVKKHCMVTIPATLQTVATAFFKGSVQGGIERVFDRFRGRAA